MKQYTLPLPIVLVLLFLFTLVIGASAMMESQQSDAVSDQRTSAAAALTWLYQENQNDDGGFGIDFRTGDPLSNVPSTLDATLALAALGYSADVPLFGAEKTVMDYLTANSASMVAFAGIDGGSNGKVILALTAARKDARSFAGQDFVSQLLAQYDLATGSYNNTTAFSQGLAIAALASVGETVPVKALEWLEALQAADGSWDDGFGTQMNADATAMAIMGLLAGGRMTRDDSVAGALDFLHDSQVDTGGWEYGPGFGENANSTALAIQALVAAGEEFADGDGPWGGKGVSPLDVLLSWQNTTGAFQADFGQGRFDDFFATAQAIPAVLGKSYPFETYLLMMPIVMGPTDSVELQ